MDVVACCISYFMGEDYNITKNTFLLTPSYMYLHPNEKGSILLRPGISLKFICEKSKIFKLLYLQ